MGERSYRYSRVVRAPAPWDLCVHYLRELVEHTMVSQGLLAENQHFDGVLFNHYRDGHDRIGAHRDAEIDMLAGADIAGVSLGATRRFVLRNTRTREKFQMHLEHGDLLVLGGPTQTCWTHEIPREPKVLGDRINLTFRRMHPGGRR